eukprot:TRINITY_DN18921_c0_g1_i1.p1 TRINITY_DN18921_c0_g1~~TRINITY_DN18921_c0_g1_i1.p1  ORF type:complete len:564 (-),score=88.35 TRINITY_DN18921_c0_g1_i1:101-1792(-)
MFAMVNICVATFLSPAVWQVASAGGFLSVSREHLSPGDHAFADAVRAVTTCGTHHAELMSAEARLEPMWRVLPKNRQGRADWALLKYLIHRFFLQQYSLLIRGFEPSLVANASNVGGELKLLRDHTAFSVVEGALKQKGQSTGFSLADAAAMVAALEHIVSEQDATTLRKAYMSVGKPTSSALDHQSLANVVEAYMIHVLVDEDADRVIKDRSLMNLAIPHWKDISDFASGAVKNIEFKRERSARPGNSRVALLHEYSFDDAHEAVAGITRSFASFWEAECQVIKASLSRLDTHHSGRVSLSDFYGANVDGEWRFGESEAYLRELGALDESSPGLGKQVIIPNYMQGANNCVVTTRNYFICCVPECESVLQDIEDSLGGPVSLPGDILPLIGNMTNFEDDAPVLDPSLIQQLVHIAELHGGKIPLHGRLFAQWLHFVFPRECPFPQRAGASSAVPPDEFIDMLASSDVVRSHAASRNSPGVQLLEADAISLQWMSRWSEEEELIADYSAHLRAPWDEKLNHMAIVGGVSIVVAIGWILASRGFDRSEFAKTGAASCKGRSYFL